MRFSELGLLEPIVRAVASEGYTDPTPIQAKAIAHVIKGQDVLGCAQTGTGKTAAFALPILHQLSETSPAGRDESGKRHTAGRPRTLVLCPTRELATQIYESFRTYGKHLKLKHTVIFGGVNQSRQVRDLRHGVDVLVATPGRLLDLINQGYIDLRGIEILVLDEADRMLDMGFINDIRKVIQMIPPRRQTLLFSATMPREIRGLADSILTKPVFVEVAPAASTAELIEQSVYMVTKPNKAALLSKLFHQQDMGRTLVFSRTKHGADKLVKILHRSGIESAAIHGNKTQNARTRALEGFRSGRMPVLIATDIASRGIDVDDVTHVINYDLPNDPETYVHRIGRTARAGASGTAVSFCDHEEIAHLRDIERLINRKLDVAGAEDDLTYIPPAHTPKPRPKPGSGRQSGPRRGRGGAAAHNHGGASGPPRRRRRRSPAGQAKGRSTTSAR